MATADPAPGRGGSVEVYYGHRVSDDVDFAALGPDPGNTVCVRDFEGWLDGLVDRRPLTWQELLEAPRPADRPGFVLTLDDGYRDNLTVALPILEARKIPVVICVTSGFISRDSRPLESELAALIHVVDMLETPDGNRVDCRTADEKREVYESIRLVLKSGGVARRDRTLGEILELNGAGSPDPAGPFLEWSELVELDRHPLVTIGAHTQTHPLLPRTSRREAEREVVGSKRTLEERLGHAVDLFAYPYGGQNFLVRRLVRRAGYRMAFTTESKPVPGRPVRHRFRVPRLDLVRAAGPGAA